MTERVCIGCGGRFDEGVHSGPPRRYCSSNCYKRTWEREKYRTSCRQCGADIDAHSKRCRTCVNAERHASREARLAFIAELYNAGVPLREMGVRLGRTSGASAVGPELAELRKRGLIGYRYEWRRERKAAA